MLDARKVTAKDVMIVDLLTLTEDTPLQEAVSTLEDYHITGAPVLNAGGQCVGVFSVSDLLKRGVEVNSGEGPRAGDYFVSDPFSDDPDDYFAKEDYDEAVLGRDTVGQWMTTTIQSVSPTTTVAGICKKMVKERIHRVLVMDGHSLMGLVSSFDVVRLVAGD